MYVNIPTTCDTTCVSPQHKYMVYPCASWLLLLAAPDPNGWRTARCQNDPSPVPPCDIARRHGGFLRPLPVVLIRKTTFAWSLDPGIKCICI